MIYLSLFFEYFKIGLFTIGGGYAMLPMVQETVLSHGWLTNLELLNFIGIAESTPGPFAINLATFVGMEVGKTTALGIFGGLLGAAIATFGVVLPSLLVIICVTQVYARFKSSKTVKAMMRGVRPVVVGLILSAVMTVFSAVVTEPSGDFDYVAFLMLICLAPLAFIKVKGKNLHPILLILVSAAVGTLFYGVLQP